MKNTIMEYLDWRGDLSFKASPFNEIDNLIFSELVFLDFSDVVSNNPSEHYPTVKEGIESFFKKNDYQTYKFGMIIPDIVKDLSIKVMNTSRYGNVKIAFYREEIIPEKTMQFCGAAFILDDGTIVISFEGTDDTIVGWRENFNMFIEEHTYAQKEAAKFVNDVAKCLLDGPIYLCGHSKGGNLAYYAGMFCNDDIKERIVKIISNDGPGLFYKRYDPEKVKIIDEKGMLIIPNASIIGQIMDQRGEIKIVESRVHNIFQHNPFDLIILGTSFVPAKKLTTNSIRIKKEFEKLYTSTSIEDAKKCIDELYNCITINDKRTLLDLKDSDYRVLRAMTKMSRTSKKIIRNMMGILINNNAWIK